MENTEFDVSKIQFANDHSREQYEAAMRGDPLPNGVKNPMIVIVGDRPGAGKSALAKQIIRVRFGSFPIRLPVPTSNDGWRKTLDAVAVGNSRFAWFDNVGSVLKARDLCRFLTAPKWTYRPLFKQTMAEVDLDCTVILTVAKGFVMTDDLWRRSRLIQLGKPSRVGIEAAAETGVDALEEARSELKRTRQMAWDHQARITALEGALEAIRDDGDLYLQDHLCERITAALALGTGERAISDLHLALEFSRATMEHNADLRDQAGDEVADAYLSRGMSLAIRVLAAHPIPTKDAYWDQIAKLPMRYGLEDADSFADRVRDEIAAVEDGRTKTRQTLREVHDVWIIRVQYEGGGVELLSDRDGMPFWTKDQLEAFKKVNELAGQMPMVEALQGSLIVEERGAE